MADENKKTEQQLRGQFQQIKREAEGIFDDIPETFEKLSEKFKGNFQKISEYIKSVKKELNELKTDFSGISRILADTVRQYRNGNDALAQALKATNKIRDVADKLRYDQAGITTLGEKDLKRMIEQLKIKREELKILYKYGGLSMEQKKDILSVLAYSHKMLEGAEERLEIEKRITAQMGLAGAAVKGLSKVLDKLGMGSLLKIEEINEKMRDAAEQNQGKWKVLGVGIRASLVSIGETLRDPVFLVGSLVKMFSSLVKMVVEFQARIFEMSKDMGVSVERGKQLFYYFRDIALTNAGLAVSAKQLSDSYSKVSSTLGFMGPINEDFLLTTNLIERRTGATAQDMQDIAMFSKATGKSFKDTYASVIGSAKATAVQLNFMMSEKQIMEAISKTSATVFNNFKGNVKQLSMAIVQATKLGLTLDQVNQASFSMLEFESSISKEFEAQLLTGKQIDLSMARQYALTGDTAALMGEITRQLGTQDEWNGMNVLKQQSLAEAFGLSKEAVDEMYKKQQLIATLGDLANASTKEQYEALMGQQKSHGEIAKLLGDETANNLLQVSIQERMAIAMENLQASFAGIFEFMIPIVDFFAKIVSNANALKWILGGAALALGSIFVYSLLTTREKTKQAQLQMKMMTLQTYLAAATLAEQKAKQGVASATAQAATAAAVEAELNSASAAAAGVEAAFKTGGAAGSATFGIGAGPAIMGVLGLLSAAMMAYGLTSGVSAPSTAFAGGGANIPTANMSPANASTSMMSSGASSGGGQYGAPAVSVHLNNNVNPWDGKTDVSYTAQYGRVPDQTPGQFSLATS